MTPEAVSGQALTNESVPKGKQINPFSEQEKHGDAAQRRQPQTEQEAHGGSVQQRAPAGEDDTAG